MVGKREQKPLNGGTALYVLERLIETARVSWDEVSRYLSEVPAEIRRLEDRIRTLRGEHASPTPAPPLLPAAPAPRAARRTVSRADAPTSAQGKALGGTYGGLIRRVPPAEQGHYEEIKRTRGIEAAIAALKARKRP